MFVWVFLTSFNTKVQQNDRSYIKAELVFSLLRLSPWCIFFGFFTRDKWELWLEHKVIKCQCILCTDSIPHLRTQESPFSHQKLSEIWPHHVPLQKENILILTLHTGKLRYSLPDGPVFQKGASNSYSKRGFSQDWKEAQHF